MKKDLIFRIIALIVIQFIIRTIAEAQSINPAFTNSYRLDSLGSVGNLPAPYGGMAFLPSNSNILLIGGSSESDLGVIHQVELLRDDSNHIIGFKGNSSFYAKAPKIDSGLVVAPGDVILFSRYPDNEIGQIMPGNTDTNKIETLTKLTGLGSIGGLGFVPKGFPGAGELRATHYQASEMYVIGIQPDGLGTFSAVSASAPMPLTGVGGAEGFVYTTPGSPLFEDYRTFLVADWSRSAIHAFKINAAGTPLVDSRLDFASGITGAFGMVMDPITGDILVSTWGGGDLIYAIRGFAAPPIANVGISQIALPNPAYVGYNLKLMLSLVNNGPGIAYNTLVTNQLPANVDFISATLSQGAYQLNSGQVICNFSNLPPKATVTIELLVKPISEGFLTNSVWVRSNSSDLNSADDNAFMVITSRKMVAPFITAQPEAQAATLGDTVGFNVAVGGGQPLSYQWRFNDKNIVGQTNSTHVVRNVTTNDVGIYTVIVSNPAGSVTSAPAALTIQVPIEPPVITQHPTNLTLFVGGNAVFSVTAKSSETVMYQWYYNGNELPGATAQSLVIGNVTQEQAGTYRVSVLNSAGSVFSEEAVLTVEIPPAPPQFLAEPRSMTANIGESVLLNAVVSGSLPLAYQWQKNGTNLPAQISSALIFQKVTLNDAGTYRVIVTNNFGMAVSQDAVLTVTSLTLAPQIVFQPQEVNAKPGTEVTLSVVASGTEPLQYQWENMAGIVVGATNATLKVIVLESVVEYRVQVKNNGGSVQSAWVKVIPDFTGYKPVITQQPQSVTTVPGVSVTLSVEATTPAGQLSYQWLFNGTNLLSANNATLILTNITVEMAGQYSVIVTSPYGSVTSDPSIVSITGLPASLAIDTYVGIAVTGTVGSKYRIEYTLDLKLTNSWIILTNIVLPTSPFLWIDTGSTNSPKRYYRALSAP